ncbi:MAG: carboxymuconolactone decarboxylase family protein [Planctomycetaceae bacterium]
MTRQLLTKGRDMPFIHWTEDDQAEGELAEVYHLWKANNPGRDKIPGILKCFGARPDFLRQVMEFSYGVHFSDGHLTRRTKEMIATFVSGLNQCPY